MYRTCYPSKVMENLLGHRIKEVFEGRDPLQEYLIKYNKIEL